MRFPLPFFLVITGIALLIGKASPALATEYFVKINGDDTADGTNWAMAFLTISNAVAQTTDGDTITVSNGTYNIDAQIYITNGITVQSTNGVAYTIVNRSASGSSAPQHRIFYLKHADAVLDGFTIKNGYIPASDGGGGVYASSSAGTLRNSIIYFSTNTTTGSTTDWYRAGGTISYSCTTPDASAYGSGNITDDPAFKNADAGDYRLRSGSPCVDVGLNQAWMTGAVDLGGNNRIVKDIVDMGAYESFVKGMIISIH